MKRIYKSDNTKKMIGLEWRDDGSYKSLIAHIWFYKIYLFGEWS